MKTIKEIEKTVAKRREKYKRSGKNIGNIYDWEKGNEDEFDFIQVLQKSGKIGGVKL